MFPSNDSNIVQSKTLTKSPISDGSNRAITSTFIEGVQGPIEAYGAIQENGLQSLNNYGAWLTEFSSTEASKSLEQQSVPIRGIDTTAGRQSNTMVSSNIFSGSEQDHQTEFIDFSYLLEDFNTLTGTCNDQVAPEPLTQPNIMTPDSVAWNNYTPFETFECSDVKSLQPTAPQSLPNTTDLPQFAVNISFPGFDADLLDIKTDMKYSTTHPENFNNNNNNSDFASTSKCALPSETNGCSYPKGSFPKAPSELAALSPLSKSPACPKSEIMVTSPSKIVAKDSPIPKKPLPPDVPKPSSSGGRKPSSKERPLHYCPMCPKGFKDKYSVNVHLRTHTGEKPYCCTVCGKNFRQKAHLGKHFQTHSRTVDPFLRKPAKRKHESLEKESVYYASQEPQHFELPTYPYASDLHYNYGVAPLTGSYSAVPNSFGLNTEQFPNR